MSSPLLDIGVSGNFLTMVFNLRPRGTTMDHTLCMTCFATIVTKHLSAFAAACHGY